MWTSDDSEFVMDRAAWDKREDVWVSWVGIGNGLVEVKSGGQRGCDSWSKSGV